MLAGQRRVKIEGKEFAQTPMLVPSFSSKGFPEIQKILETMSSVIAESALISAYDVSYGLIKGPITFPELLFLDSGGYECSKDTELSDLGYLDHAARDWSTAHLSKVLDEWKFDIPTICVSYDHPKERVPISDQIERARRLFEKRRVGRELLIKPGKGQERVQIDEIIASIHELRHFDVIGFTEKELGFSLFKRMTNIALVRRELTNAGLDIPIHVFGSLDPISSPLYFLAGADIFDGLTWLRLAYHKGQAIYMHNAAAIEHGPHINDKNVEPQIWFSNHHQMRELELSMKRYLREQSFSSFTYHAELFERVSRGLEAKISGDDHGR